MSPHKIGSSSGGSRAFHNKSRHGCRRCKERRVRCDAKRPVCNHCYRRNEKCSNSEDNITKGSYIIPKEQLVPVVQFSLDPASRGLVYRIPIARPVLLASLIKGVMNEFGPTSAYEASLWHKNLLQSGLANDNFLWHSLSALHLLILGHSHNNFELRYKTLEIAYRHHITASRSFNLMIPQITQRNWAVFFAFASSIIICQLAMQTTCPDSLFDYVEAFQILRASRAVNEALGGWLRASEMYPMMAQRTILTEIEGMGDCGLNDALLILEDAVGQKVSYSKSLDYMSLAMQSMKDWVKLCNGQPRRWHHFIYWPGSVPERFLEAVRQDETFALVLFLYWLAISRLARPRWFMERWVIRAAHHIMGKLSFEWDELTAWPISIISMGRDELSFQSKRPTIDAT